MQVAHAACAAERHVGTLGGGMDQAACCMAQEGAALHVTFDPVSDVMHAHAHAHVLSHQLPELNQHAPVDCSSVRGVLLQ